MITDIKQQTALVYPAHWRTDTVDCYERLHSLRKVTQADVDEIVAKLDWWREWRDYFSTTGGVDYHARENLIASGE